MVTVDTGLPWLEPLLEGQAGDENAPTVVLCRTSVQMHSLRRLLAQRGGALGIHVSTAEAFALAKGPTRLPGNLPAPTVEEPESPLLKLIGERPRLLEHARDWARTARLHMQAGGQPEDLPPELVELAQSGWGKSEAEEAICGVLEKLSALADVASRRESLEVGSVFCHGYMTPANGLAPSWESAFLADWLPDAPTSDHPLVPVPKWESWMLSLLDAQPLDVGETHAGWSERSSLPAVQVPDVGAEARLAISLLKEQNAGEHACLVLVPDAQHAARLRDAGLRNGVRIAEAAATPLAGHPVARIVRVAAAWFQEDSDPLVRASHLKRVLTDRVLGQGMPADLKHTLEEWTSNLFGPEPEEMPEQPVRLSRRQLTAAIVNSRIVEAPLSHWISQTKAQAAATTSRAGSDTEFERKTLRTAWQARLLQARLELLAACTTGAPLPTELGNHEVDDLETGYLGAELDDAVDPEDVDAVSKPPVAAPGTFGALRRFLTLCKLHVRDDPAGKAVMAVLKEHQDDLVSGAAVETLLAGSCTTGVLTEGVEVLLYDDYDGRPASLVLALGMHNKGIAGTPAPDPLASADVLWRVGLLGGREMVKFRLLQALRAAGRAQTALALVSSRDASGRLVVPPVEVSLDMGAGAPLLPDDNHAADVACDSFGLTLPTLPETTSRGHLTKEETAQDQVSFPPASPTGAERFSHLAVQASAEWYRAGMGIGQPPLAQGDIEDVRMTPLSDLLERSGEFAPQWLRRYLGEVPDSESGRLDPSRSWSVSSYFTPLTHCLYQLFAKRVLGLREEEKISDDLLPREVGNAVHNALENLGPQIRWQVADEEAAEVARIEGQALLAEGVAAEFIKQLESLGHVPPAMTAAVDGLTGRWAKRWAVYLSDRIRTNSKLEKATLKSVNAIIRESQKYQDAFELLDKEYSDWEVNEREKHLRNWLSWAFLTVAGDVELGDIQDEKELLSGQGAIAKKVNNQGALKGRMLDFVRRPDFMSILQSAGPEVQENLRATAAISGTLVQTMAEVPFGRATADDSSQPMAQLGLTFKGTPLSTHGRIDSLRQRAHTGRTALEIVDYKAGHVKIKSVLESGIVSMRLPQLVVYALALEDLIAQGKPPPGVPLKAKVGAIAYDYVHGDATNGLSEFLVSVEQLNSARSVLAALVERAEKGEWALAPHPSECPALQQYGGDYCPFAMSCRFQSYPVVPDLSDEQEKEEEE